MARQNSLLKIEGTIAGMTFYKTKDGYLVKEKSSISKKRIATDPAFQRTRENGQEFGMACKSGKMLRDCIRVFMAHAADDRVVSRLTKVMSGILKEDKTSIRGSRNVATGIKTPDGNALLKNFNFNLNAILGSVLFKPVVIDPLTGIITIADLIPKNEIEAPQGATHAAIKSAFISLDFNTGKAQVEYSTPINLALDMTLSTVQLTPNAVPASTPDTTAMHLFLIEFYQEVNGLQYPLNNGIYNCLEIIEVV